MDTAWTKTYTKYAYAHPQDCYIISDGGFLLIGRKTARGSPDSTWLIKTDSLGMIKWCRRYPQIIKSIYERSDGHLLTTVESSGYLILDSAGKKLEEIQFSPKTVCRSIQLTSDSGFLVLAADSLLKLTKSGDLHWTKPLRFDCNSVLETPQGHFLLAGCEQEMDEAGIHSVVMEVDGHGEEIAYKYIVRGNADDASPKHNVSILCPARNGCMLLKTRMTGDEAGLYYFYGLAAYGNDTWKFPALSYVYDVKVSSCFITADNQIASSWAFYDLNQSKIVLADTLNTNVKSFILEPFSGVTKVLPTLDGGFAMVGGCLWLAKIIKRDTSKTATLIPEKNAQRTFAISFIPSRTHPLIRYSLRQSGKVHLALFDVSGKEVETLVNTYQNQGCYSVFCSSDRISSGNYFLRLQSNSLVITDNIVLIK